MRVNSIEVTGLNKSDVPINLSFNDDINIITGRNGSGKTTLLKLLWYCISGNIERAVREITFSYVKIKTSEYTLELKKPVIKQKEFINVILFDDQGKQLFDLQEPINREDVVERANHETINLLPRSLFFPTFRRIEGGFSMDDDTSHSRRVVRNKDGFRYVSRSSPSGIQSALEGHADMLSVQGHKFVSSISTVDIKKLVLQRHNQATIQVDNYSKSLSDQIILEIKNYKRNKFSDADALKAAVSTLNKINKDVLGLEETREEAFQSLNILSEIIVTIFKHKGIRLNPDVTLGDIENSINSDSLSAGEKQMLSFLCYNALYSNCPFFIDEPELSLHVDWQRILLEVMVNQKTKNQLFIATHSPFIYTQYEDKEIVLSHDRGDSLES